MTGSLKIVLVGLTGLIAWSHVADAQPETRPPTTSQIEQILEVRREARRFEVASIAHEETLVENGSSAGAAQAAHAGVARGLEELIAQLEAYLETAPVDVTLVPSALDLLANLYLDRAESLDGALAFAVDGAGLDAHDGDHMVIAEAMAAEVRERIVSEFPAYPDLGNVLHRLAESYLDAARYDDAKRALQRLLCGNRRSEIDAANLAQDKGGDELTARLYAGAVGLDSYDNCVPLLADGLFVDGAWVLLGQLHRTTFGESDLAIGAFTRVASNDKSENYLDAAQELAGALVDNGMLIEAIPVLDELVLHIDKSEDKSEDKSKHKDEHEQLDALAVELRSQSIQRIATILARLWQESALPDQGASLKLATIYYHSGREHQAHVRDVFDAFGDALREFGAYEQAIPVWEHTIDTWKTHADTPVAYDKLVQLLVEKGDMAGADRERRELLDTIRASSAWRRANTDDANVLATAAALGEQTLFLLASNEARQARLVYEDLAAEPTSRYPDAVALYQSAASLLEQFMTDYPSSERTYDLGMLLGEVYYFDDRMDDAGRAFKAVRDARPGGKHFERAARGTAEVFEAAIEAAVDRGDLTLPPEPDKDLFGTSPEPIDLPQLVAELVAAYDAWREFAPPLVAPQIALGAANIELRYLHVAAAEKRFNAIVDQYCHTSEAKEARDHLLEIYDARGDTETRDRVSFDYAKNICGDSQPVRVVKSVKIERDYGGAEQDYNDGKFLDAARGFYSVHTAVDASHKYHAEALYRAADSMQRAGKVATAASLWSEFTDNVDLRASPLYPEALLAEAQAYRAAFDYEAAVAAYLDLAAVADKHGSSGRANFDVRAEAHAGLWQAAELRNLDRVYYDRGANDPGAATLFIRFATAESDPVKASEAYLRAADVYQNAGDASHLIDTYREWEQRFNRAKGVDAYHVHFLFRIAKAEEKSGDRRGALKSFAQVIDAYNKAKTPGSAETEMAGESQFWLAEQKYRLFERYEFVWPAELTNEAVEAIAGPLVKLMEEATAEFGKLAQLKSTWTIAAAVRVGDVSAVFAHKIIDSPAPTSIGKGEDIAQEILDTFVDLMAEVAAPLFAEAEKQWQYALDTAKTDGVRNEWSKLALERLNAANPQKYPLLRDEIISREEEP